MKLWVLIPIKGFDAAKQRLAGTLEPAARRALAVDGARTVIAAALGAPAATRVCVVSNDPEVREFALGCGAALIDEPPAATDAPPHLNAIMAAAFDRAAALGASAACYLPSDLPRITAQSLQQFLTQHRAGMSLAAAASDGGTNAMVIDLPRRFEFAFGAGSAARHARHARQVGLAVRQIDDARLTFDLDTPADWRRYDLGEGVLQTLDEARRGGADTPLTQLMQRAAALRDRGFPSVMTYSRKVFIPLTRLCRDVCHYCSFATTPSKLAAPYLEIDEVMAIAEAGRDAGCHEALFTLGDRPESRYRVAREWLAARGYDSTVEYLAAAAGAVMERTGLLPHINAGVLSEPQFARLRAVSASMGLMLETSAARLSQRGGAHFGSPDKQPQLRLDSIAAAGRAQVPLTTGLLIGIGETRDERLESLFALRELHLAHGHLQELILQNFLPKNGTRMSSLPGAPLAELQWTIAMARLIFGHGMSLQAPPNLNGGRLRELIDAGINDWGGVSPVTIDHVNPESPWPQIAALADETAAAGRSLVPRLTVYPAYVAARARWLDPAVAPRVLQHSDAEGLARTDRWHAGSQQPISQGASARGHESANGRAASAAARAASHGLTPLVARASRGERLEPADIVRLFAARGDELDELFHAADALRHATRGDAVSYVVNRNINYTNICQYKCSFCAFSKGRAAPQFRGPAYLLDPDEVAARALEAHARGATEVCMQGGIHPQFTGATYLELLRAVKRAVPQMHVHAFSPLEVQHGASTLGLPIETYLERLQDAGLGSLPGTAAEILDDPVRRQICQDKLRSAEWLEVIEAAHRVGLPTTATIMFGHLETPLSWARHLLAIRDLQARSGGFTEFVPLPFVHMEAPMYKRGLARRGPTWREAALMHAVARLVLHPVITSIQASWVKLGPAGAAQCLDLGVNDLGGVLMNESISRAAGAAHGQELTAADLRQLIIGAGRTPRQRTTLYGAAGAADAAARFATLDEISLPAGRVNPSPAAQPGCSAPARTSAPATAPDRRSA